MQPTPMPPDKPKNWFQRNWKWMIPSGCFGIIVSVLALMALIFYIVQSAMKSSDAYKEALTRAKTNPTVIKELGEPIEAGWWTNGSIKVNSDSGRAELSIPISGPKNSATLYLLASKAGGRWNFSRLEVTIDGTNQTVNLLTTAR